MLSWVMLGFAILTVLAAIGVVFSRKSLHSALWLVAAFLLVAVHYAMLGADFVAALQVLIYAGAIMVLVVFVIMLLGLGEDADRSSFPIPGYLAAVLCGVFVGIIVFVVSKEAVFKVAPGGSASSGGGAKEVGMLLFTEFLFPFEIVGLLLFAAILGAVILGFEQKRPLGLGRGLRAVRESGGREEQKQ